MSTRPDTTQIDLLTQILARLQQQLGLTENQCYLGMPTRLFEVIPRGGDYILAVSPGSGSFVPGEQAFGNVTEEWTFKVTIYVRCALDRPDEARSALVDATRGLYQRKRQVLAALVGWDLGLGQRALVHALDCTEPEPMMDAQNPGRTFWQMTLTFGLPFDWQLP